MGNRDYGSDPPTPESIFGKQYVSVGPPGSGANYDTGGHGGADDFNAAVSYLNGLANPGGTIYVLPGKYVSTLEWVLTGANITVIWDPAALLAPTALNTSPIAPGGGNSGTKPFVVGGTSTAPCSHCTIYGGPIVDGTAFAALHATSNIFGIFIGGNVYDLLVIRQKGTNLYNFSAWVNGYALPNATSTAYDGPCVNIRFVDRYSDSCGNANTPDGGGIKCSPESSVLGTTTQAAIQNVFDSGFSDTNVYFSGHDIASGTTPGHTMDNIQAIGGYAQGNANTVGNGFFVEQGVSGTVTNVKVVGVEVTGFKYGFSMGQSFADVTSCTAINCGTAGFTTGVGSAVQLTIYGHKYVSCHAVGCTAGFLFSTQHATTGTAFIDFSLTDCSADDASYGVMASSLTIYATAASPIVNLRVSNCDFSRYASGGVPLTFSSGTTQACPGLSFSNVVGITDTGLLGTGNPGGFTTPIGTTQMFECRNAGSLSKPANASTNTYRIRTGLNGNLTTIASAASSYTITALSHWGNPLANCSALGTTGTAAASTDYVFAAAETSMTIAVGTSSGLSITLFDPFGRLVLSGAASCSAVVVAAGSILNLGAFTGSPTFTFTTLGATPFTAAITGVASFATTTFDYNSTLQYVTNTTTGTVTYKVGTATVTNPFFNYYECSLAGGVGTTVVANRTYEASMVSYLMSCGTSVAFALDDQLGNALSNVSTTVYQGRCPRGWRFSCTTAGTFLFFADNA